MSPALRLLLYRVDIVVIALAYFALEAGADAIPGDFRIGIVASMVGKCVLFVFICFWLQLRGDTVATIGLTKPLSWPRSILGGRNGRGCAFHRGVSVGTRWVSS